MSLDLTTNISYLVYLIKQYLEIRTGIGPTQSDVGSICFVPATFFRHISSDLDAREKPGDCANSRALSSFSLFVELICVAPSVKS